MKSLNTLIALVLVTGVSFGQNFQSTLGMFAKKSIPYESPTDTYTDQYLEDGEESSIPFKELSPQQFEEISGSEDCRCTAYAVDYFDLKGGKKGLVVYQVNLVEVMPYELLTYDLYIVDQVGKPIDDIRLSSDFFTSDGSGDLSYSEQKKSRISNGDYDDMEDRLFIEMTYDNSEIVHADFGQVRTVTSVVYWEILPTGKMEDVTTYLEE